MYVMKLFLNLKVHKHDFFILFCRNRILMVPRACNTRFFKNCIRFGPDIGLLNISAYAQSTMKSFPPMLSQHLNHFLICSGCDKSFPRMLSIPVHLKTVNIFLLAEHKRKFLWRMLSVQ